MENTILLSRLLETYFTDRLMRLQKVSTHTIASYRDTFRLLLHFAQRCFKKIPSQLKLADIDYHFLSDFLEYLEKHRGNCIRTRNARLSAIHSFFKYAAMQEPALSGTVQRVLAIPRKRHDRTQVEFLTRQEVEAVLAAPDSTTWTGCRDRTLLLLAVQTGLRVSELLGLRCQDVTLRSGPHVRCRGKGRKERCTPLRKETVKALHGWLNIRKARPSEVLFPNARGDQLSRDGVGYILKKYVDIAAMSCPSIQGKRVTPHVLRHTAAMDLLQHGIDRSVIALWLGHESIETTQIYLHASLDIKTEALAKTAPLNGRTARYRPEDHLMAFLKGL